MTLVSTVEVEAFTSVMFLLFWCQLRVAEIYGRTW